MLLPRLIPCLLIHNNGLYKTVKFKDPKYVGDPLNAVKIFNEKQVDELMVLDIDATVNASEPNYERIAQLASQCRMPLCYGGGIKSVRQAERIFSLGVEKIAISSAMLENPSIIEKIASRVGSQSIVSVVDVKKRRFSKKYDVYTHRGTRKHSVSLESLVEQIVSNGAGEIVLNFIDDDGCMQGFNIELIQQIRSLISIPLTILGGAGCAGDIRQVVDNFGLIGIGVGSLFVFKGKYKAVLINYPTPEEKEKLLNISC